MALRRAQERPVAPVRHDDIARPKLAQRVEEGHQAHLVAAADKSARGKPRRDLAGLQLQRRPPSPKRATSPGTSTSASERLMARMSMCAQRLLEGAAARGQLTHARVGGNQRALRLGSPHDAGKGVGGFIAERGHVDDVGRERLIAQVGLLQQRVGAAEGEDGRVAVVRGQQHRGARRRAPVAHGPAGRHTFLQQVTEHGLGALILAELDQRRHVETEARHGHGGIDRSAADVGGDLDAPPSCDPPPAAGRSCPRSSCVMRSMRSLAMMAIVSIMAPPTVRAFMPAPPAPSARRGTTRRAQAPTGVRRR